MYGFEYKTLTGRLFRLDQISPGIFLENLYVSGAGYKRIERSYDNLPNLCDIFCTLKSANMDSPYTSGPSISITNPYQGGIVIEINPSQSGANAFYHLTIYARPII
ncbi:MAG: hypothetical protein ACRCVV_19185 [Shewanella sp.]